MFIKLVDKEQIYIVNSEYISYLYLGEDEGKYYILIRFLDKRETPIIIESEDKEYILNILYSLESKLSITNLNSDKELEGGMTEEIAKSMYVASKNYLDKLEEW